MLSLQKGLHDEETTLTTSHQPDECSDIRRRPSILMCGIHKSRDMPPIREVKQTAMCSDYVSLGGGGVTWFGVGVLSGS